MTEAIKENLIEEEEAQLEEVVVLDDASAQYLLNRIREANEQYERMEAWYAHQTQKAKDLRDRTVEWAERSLRGYFDMVPTKDTKTQRKYELPGGTLILKAQQPKFEINDEEAVKWLKANDMGEYIKVNESTNWAELKKAVKVSGNAVATADGEIIPGITVEEREPVFQVTVK